ALATRAYRRPLTEDDVKTLLGFYRDGRAGSFYDGIQRGVERTLAAPSFLFRIEREPSGLAPGATYQLSDLELASRLSFFLWGSIPDNELREAAVRGKLHDQDILEQQVRRMLRDRRSQSVVDNFANRWLEVNKLTGMVPDTELYSEFDENLREAMADETRTFVATQMREGRSIPELSTANYTFLTDR